MLSDKTGTLTQNVMGFVWASIGGIMYNKGGLHPLPAEGSPSTATLGQGSTSLGFPPAGSSVTAGGRSAAVMSAGSGGGGGGGGDAAVGGVRQPQHVPDRTPHSVCLDGGLHGKLGSHFEKLAGWEPRYGRAGGWGGWGRW